MRCSEEARRLTRLACVVFVSTLALSTATNVQGLDVVWEQVSSDAGFAGRDSPGSAVLNGNMWVMGGVISGGVSNDVWYSPNGADWTEATSAAGWTARNLQASVAYDNKLWVMGGWGRSPGLTPLGDVWYSADGASWTQAAASTSWGTRGGASSLVYDDKMWIFGGSYYDGATFTDYNDVWYSTDGTNWTAATTNASWGARSYASTVVHDGKMWLYGGRGEGTAVNYNDVWYSTDGTNWTQATAAAPWSARYIQGEAVYDNKMWITAGYGTGFLGDTWFSTDGVNWEEAVAATGQWSNRYAPAVMSHDDKLWVVAGYSGTLQNDVWAYDKTVVPPDPPPPGSKLLHWDMDTLNGDDVADVSGNGNDGVLEVVSELGTITRVETGGPFAASPAYYDLQPAGAEDTLGVRINGGSDWSLNAQLGDYSVSVWFKDVGSSPFGEMVSRYELSTDGAYYIAYDGAGGVAMFHRPPGGDYNYATTAITGDLSDWHHAVGVFEEGVGTTVWVDGVAGTTDGTVTTPIGPITDMFLAGAEGTGSGNRYPFDGGLDEVQLFNSALSETEILALMQTNSVDPLGGDFDLDGDVDVTDLGTLATSYGTPSGADWSTGDANFDGAVNVTDLGILATNYGTGTAAGVPEPSMGLLVFMGLLAIGLRGWRR